MAEEKRSPASAKANSGIGTGPYLARIVSHLDPSFMGSLEVTLLREQSNTLGSDSETHVVRCAVPFFGYTGYEFMGQNTAQSGLSTTLDAFNDTQKSYGMWFVPPDIGVNVLVTFVDGDPSQGYWFACVPGRFANNMVPALAGSTEVDMDAADKKKYDTKMPLPVAEVNKRLNSKDGVINVDKIKKPLHPIAEAFLRQGLVEEDVRGVTTSSSRREAPSMVFGISTPGPLDKRTNAKKSFIGKLQDQTKKPVAVSRLGGSSFVMDDGDDRYLRATPAGEGPVKYVDTLNAAAGEKGNVEIPYNEYIRLRTRTGHQILMHNSEDLIYIGNAKGTSWIEMTSNGKIDIYAADSVSIHSEVDLNIRADRDINLEAGRNINMKSETGRFHLETFTDFEVLVNGDARITVGGDHNLLVGADNKISTKGNFGLATGGDNNFSATGNTNIGSGGDHIESASVIHMNDTAAAAPADVADFVKPLELHDNPATSTSVGWPGKKYQAGTFTSIMKRIPMHEPWLLHENQAPQLLTPSDTDREA